MKSFIAIALTYLLLACNHNQKLIDTEKNAEEAAAVKADVGENSDNGNDIDKRAKEPKKLKQLPPEEWEALLPKEINGFKRTNYSAVTFLSPGIIKAKYLKDDGTEIDLLIKDYVEEATESNSPETEDKHDYRIKTEDGYTYKKTVELVDGMKACEIGEVDEEDGKTSILLIYAAHNRFAVFLTLTGALEQREAVIEMAKSLRLKV